MVIFLDEILFENFLVNLFILSITLQTIKKKTKFTKEIISAAFGSLYVLVMVIPRLNFLHGRLFNVIMAFIMIIICLRKEGKLICIKGTVIFILYAMLLAGATYYFSLNNNPKLLFNNAMFKFNYKKIVLSGMILYLIINRVVVYVKDRKILHNYIYTIDIFVNNKKLTVKGFLDTGNELREPITDLPVIIVEKDVLKELELTNYAKYSIGYSVVNGKDGKLEGFKPDSISIAFEENVVLKDAIIAFCDNKLSKGNDYNALLPRGIII
ncbi:MAG: sigma-E processing peptidase SpoIIGA [Clostridium argentinense]|uniref:Sporulation sigma-E factor-processing peptidase n=1 Tax=Clostridium faecium TaxID=2762223 RepID=A0ABR8YPN0_9CLOT|nr:MULTISPECIES: sigma-E processing peptidase SpoIIGA [Clostridium]MBD8046161.1 sigma-E processing peptidase SpoIIGA [Clostridium faecium]MBS5823650.1 sigma-E processing peptidase SpoIIGA [Clostridium argentinense]MDU1347729.1 sigma-E processing peptidase SpoIIGA [Clostridium argentinense]